MKDLEKQFDLAMLEIYTRAKSEIKYNATAFFQLLKTRGGLGTAKYLINATRPSDGYTKLYELGRLDLTVEAMIVDDEMWHDLFDQEEIEKAKRRLKTYHYSFK